MAYTEKEITALAEEIAVNAELINNPKKGLIAELISLQRDIQELETRLETKMNGLKVEIDSERIIYRNARGRQTKILGWAFGFVQAVVIALIALAFAN